ncbi:glycosyltransferase family 2 protein [Pseudomonas sp. ZM23]|uniref:Glycosyltransferase family A protein n=1 Tax=Pseudomonas triclosanedens TaxID=2961893 RepID=A0ABY7A5Q3_9PSED|nr:glycosyltransferase family A protein [Pseudomonas triclosanedens]MCP8464775.1 glycosyltransferase family 2 protein [Pseudomonas triclosanedens]MCP8470512.1 glycosyltransferase family 2 protein [Pseudomonas triclosanedens]MCP8476318.1 glycosyltransferase family 2 protein [Pseudomonas triclosanedens]WAI51453.1 glycosyltransferase family A protein [Pseudomonas triclosanedens]
MGRDIVSIVMTFHAEAHLAHWSLLGFERLRRVSEAAGINMQLVAVLDSADIDTGRIVRSHPVLRRSDVCLATRHSDPAIARNSGIDAASGSYLGILDGDDYCSANWVVESLGMLRRYPQVVVHTDYLVVFGSAWGMGRLSDQLIGEGQLESCFKHHLWVSTVIAPREVFLACPYRGSQMATSGFGYEDWDWSLAVLAQGIRHTTAPGTALFYRQKVTQSRQRDATAQQVVLQPGPFFSSKLWRH